MDKVYDLSRRIKTINKMKLKGTLFIIVVLLPFVIVGQIHTPPFFEYQINDAPSKEVLKSNFEKVFSVKLTQLQNLSIANPISIPQNLVLRTPTKENLTVQLDRPTHLKNQEIYLWNGRLPDSRFDHLPHYRNVIIIYNPKTNKFAGSFLFQEGEFLLLPSKENDENYWFVKTATELQCTLLDSNSGATANMRSPDCECTETDQNGDYVIDIFIGYSDLAANIAGDINAHAALMVASVNQGLTNSLVDDVYLRLVGTGTTENNPGIITSVLSDCLDWFATEIEMTGADYVSVFQTPTGAPGSAGGWAGVGGFTSVNNIHQPNAFRHEIGHNAGGGHCPGDGSTLPIAHGFDNGNWRTHLCGNDVNFYSTPLVNDNNGNPIGDAATADMAETFSVRAASITGRLRHQIPYYVGDTCVDLICRPQHFASQNEVITNIQLNAINNSSGGWECSNVPGYSDYIETSTDLLIGTTYPITITPNRSWDNSRLNVWVDWNDNKEFEASEHIINLMGIGPWTENITPPIGTTIGQKRLRIRLQFGASYVPDPCNGSGYNGGETEDYTINLLQALPVQLSEVKIQCTDDGLELNWETISEQNNLGFQIERSEDGRNWEKVGWQPAFGNGYSNQIQNYQYKLPFSQASYFRLKQLDQDSDFSFSPILFEPCVSNNKVKLFSIYPNPTKNLITIKAEANIDQPYTIRLFNHLGILVRALESTDLETIIPVSDLTNGIYIYQITNQKGLNQQGRIIKVN